MTFSVELHSTFSHPSYSEWRGRKLSTQNSWGYRQEFLVDVIIAWVHMEAFRLEDAEKTGLILDAALTGHQ